VRGLDGNASMPEDTDHDLPMPFRPRSPEAYRRKGHLLANPLSEHPDPEVMSVQGWCNVRYRRFSLYAAAAIEGGDRAGLRQLFHYGARSSVNRSLLSYVNTDDPDRSELELKHKRKWSDGSESLIFSQRDFVERRTGEKFSQLRVWLRNSDSSAVIWLLIHFGNSNSLNVPNNLMTIGALTKKTNFCDG
jgi:hypothetical protein